MHSRAAVAAGHSPQDKLLPSAVLCFTSRPVLAHHISGSLLPGSPGFQPYLSSGLDYHGFCAGTGFRIGLGGTLYAVAYPPTASLGKVMRTNVLGLQPG